MIHRITGRHLFIQNFGAAAWLKAETDIEGQIAKVYSRVHQAIHQIGLDALMKLTHRCIYTEVVFALEAPVDLLYTACAILEWASEVEPAFDLVTETFEKEGNTNWRAVRKWAADHKIPCVDDEDGLTLGMGCFAQTWPLNALPSVTSLHPDTFQRIPAVYITGTNGKTTSSRMLSAICRASKKFSGVGQTSTDGVSINGEWVERGDWTGPGAARMILRDSRVDVAILETARGGLMRRGLVIDGVEAAAITNVSDDHLGAWGIRTVRDMAIAKLTVTLGVKEGGVVLLNADCAPLMTAWQDFQQRHPERTWTVQLFSSTQSEGMSVYLDGGMLCHREFGPILKISDIPLTLGGRAMYNVENAMVAMALAVSMGIGVEAIREGLAQLRPIQQESRGRSNWLRYQGADIFVDFAHNPDGIRRIVEMGERWTSTRKAIVLGQASDREDQEIAGLALQAMKLGAEMYFLKELPGHAYHRPASEVVDVLQATLQTHGVTTAQISRATNDLDCAQKAMDWVQQGDLLILLCHEEQDAVMDFLLKKGAEWATSMV